ncbi:YceD family protein [Desulfurobacterium sp.]
MKRYVNLREITVKEPLKVDTEFGEKLLDLPAEEVVRATPFSLHVEIHKRAVGYNVRGQIKGTVTLRCSRCDREYQEKIDGSFSFDLLPTSEITEGQIKHGELDVKFSDEDVVDLADVVREQIFLNLPVKPLCGEKCELEDYKEWNGEEKDERWSKLKQLKEKLDRKEK